MDSIDVRKVKQADVQLSYKHLLELHLLFIAKVCGGFTVVHYYDAAAAGCRAIISCLKKIKMNLKNHTDRYIII